MPEPFPGSSPGWGWQEEAGTLIGFWSHPLGPFCYRWTGASSAGGGLCLGEMKAYWVPGVALCLLLGPLVGEWRLCPSCCLPGCLGSWGAGMRGGPVLGALRSDNPRLLCRGQASAGGRRYCITPLFFLVCVWVGWGQKSEPGGSWLIPSKRSRSPGSAQRQAV